jgi:hypothetical protein
MMRAEAKISLLFVSGRALLRETHPKTHHRVAGWRKGPSNQWLIGKAFESNGEEKGDVTNCHESATGRKEYSKN